MATATAAPSEDASPGESDRVTRTHTGTSDASAELEPAPRRPAASPSADERLPAPLQYRDPARYEIVAEHGRGGLGRVFRARDKELGRDVALKELLSRGSTTELRFFREALITARLEHPGIVPVHEAGRWPDGTPFYAMKLVAGRPLKALIDECKTLEDRLALLPHVIAVADAIAYAHDRKIIHRDLKPSNIIVGDFGETVVIDWGLAKDISDQAPADDPVEDGPYRTAAPASDGVTVAGSIVGTPAYMSPEQARGEPVDERTDVYAIGAILRELTHCGAQPQRFVARSVDPDLKAIQRRATSARLMERYRSASELSRDLRAYTTAAKITARRYGLGSLLRLWYRRNPRLAIVVVVALGLVLLVATSSALTIIAERDDARRARESETTARKHADRQRDAAILAQARMAFERDPTAAHDLLAKGTPTMDASVLISRAKGARIASHSFGVSQQLTDATFSHDGAEIIYSSADRRLRIASLSTGSISLPSRTIPEYAPLARQGSGWWFVDSPHSRPELRHTSSPVHIPLRAEARSIHATSTRSIALLADGTLVSFDAEATLREVGRNIVASALVDDGTILACTSSGTLLTGNSDTQPLRPDGTCDPRASRTSLVASGRTAVIPTTHDTLTIVSGGTRTSYTLSHAPARSVAVCRDGLIGIVDGDQRGHFIDEKRELRRGFPRDRRTNRVDCNGNRIAWAYEDGTVMVLDTTTPSDWTIRAHTSALDVLELSDDGNKLLTGTLNLVRVWDLSSFEPMPAVDSDCLAFNLVQSQASPALVAADCSTGHAWVFDIERGEGRPVHRHRELSFGVAWLGHTVCSGGWDGKVLCTDTRDDTSQTVAEHPVATRWLTSDDTALFYITADGGVWTYSPGSDAAKSRRIATIDEEPYRVAVQANQLLVSTRGGRVVTIDRETGASTVHPSHSSLTALTVGADVAYSSAYDGTVQEWHETTPSQRWRFTGKLRNVRAIGAQGFAATLDDESLAIVSDTTNVLVSVGGAISTVVASPEEIGLVVAKNELLVLDRAATRATTIPIHDGHIRALQPISAGRFALATSTGALYVVDPSKYQATTLDRKASHEEDQAPPLPFDCSQSFARLAFRGCRWRANNRKQSV